MTDDEVIAAAKRGDPHAWRELYRAHAGRLQLWLEARSGRDSAVSAEDVAADTWLTAADKIGDFTGSASEFGGWLFGIGRYVAANTRRRSGRRSTDPVSTPPDGTPLPGVDEAVGQRAWVRAALAPLPPRERDVLACLEVIGLDVAETARSLEMSAVAVRVARHRGLKRLRGMLEAGQSSSPSAAATS